MLSHDIMLEIFFYIVSWLQNESPTFLSVRSEILHYDVEYCVLSGYIMYRWDCMPGLILQNCFVLKFYHKI